MGGVCLYSSPDQDAKLCGRYVVGSGFLCEYHEHNNSPQKLTAREFTEKLKSEYHNVKNGDWRGFEFPNGVKLDHLEIDYPVDLRRAIFGEITIENVLFKARVNFSNCRFEGELNLIATFNDETNFDKSVFDGRTTFSGSFNKHISFSGSIFKDAVTFRGGRDITMYASGGSMKISTHVNANLSSVHDKDKVEHFTFKAIINELLYVYAYIIKQAISAYAALILSVRNLKIVQRRKVDDITNGIKIRRLFAAVVHMEDVYFYEPERTKFMGVDLFRTHLVGTDMRGVHLFDVNWYQPELGRRGLQDDVSVRSTQDEHYRQYILPRIEAEYRNIRVALEDNKDYLTATDFYVGELEIRRLKKSFWRRHLFSIEAIYHALSLYGSSIWRAVRVMFELILLHFLATWYLLDSGSTSAITIFTNSLKVLTLQRYGAFLDISSHQRLLDASFGIIGPIQIALIVLAMRSRIKRH